MDREDKSRCPIAAERLDFIFEFVFKSLKARALADFRHRLKFHSNNTADRRDVIGVGMHSL